MSEEQSTVILDKDITTTTDTYFQEAFWQKLQQFKFDIIYYNLHFSRCIKILRSTKYASTGFTAIATSIWMNWYDIKPIAIVCCVIVLILQAFNVLIEQLPFSERKLEIREMTNELHNLYIEMECNWRDISEGKFKKSQIKLMLKKYEQKRSDIHSHYFKNDSLPETKKITEEANKRTKEYFDSFK